jgi:hypothetical protein
MPRGGWSHDGVRDRHNTRIVPVSTPAELDMQRRWGGM